MASFLRKCATATARPSSAVDYLSYRCGRNTAEVAFGGKLGAATYSELLTVRNLRPSPAETRLIDSLPGAGAILDVGAHVGIWTIPLALRHPGATIHAFEANPRVLVTLQENVARNRLRNVLTVHGAAYDRNGTLQFEVPDGSSVFGRISAKRNERHRYDRVISCEVPAIRLTDYCSQQNIQAIEFLELDVEGAEIEILRGLLPMLKKHLVERTWIEIEPDNLREMVTRYPSWRRLCASVAIPSAVWPSHTGRSTSLTSASPTCWPFRHN